MSNEIEALAKILQDSHSIVFFGGAGVSTESGIPDFRSANGIFSKAWGRHLHPEEIVSHDFLMSNPDEFYDFYKAHLCTVDVKPNPCHLALAKLEQMGKLKAVVTQNIDGLHQQAGSKTVYELHGSTWRNYCLNCGKEFPLSYLMETDGTPYCDDCGGMVRPDVVLFGEGLDNAVINRSVQAIMAADTLIIGGTSLVVYPAAGLIQYFRGEHLVIINKSATQTDENADLAIHAPIGKVFAEAMTVLETTEGNR